MNKFSHITEDGNIKMVDISNKEVIKRTAIAVGRIYLKSETIELLKEKLLKKGDVLTTAKIAGIVGAKKTSDLIPLTHNIKVDFADIQFNVRTNCIEITSKVITTDKTGIEMEALTAVNVAALTIYDMCKAVDKEMKISEIYLKEKRKEKLRKFKILAINISKNKGEKKKPIKDKIQLIKNWGIKGDAHAKNWHRQISLLDNKDIKEFNKKGIEISFGDFAENITTDGINLSKIPIGTKLILGDAIVEITQIGKECHEHCEIYKQIGDCVMPKKGVFAKVIKEGEISNESDCCYYL